MKSVCLSILSTLALTAEENELPRHNHPAPKENLTLDDGLEDWFPELRPDDTDRNTMKRMNAKDITGDEKRFLAGSMQTAH